GNRGAARVHYADEPQFLRKLQPGAADGDRAALSLPRPGGHGRPQGGAAREWAGGAGCGARPRHADQAQGPRFRARPAAFGSGAAAAHVGDRRLDPIAAGNDFLIGGLQVVADRGLTVRERRVAEVLDAQLIHEALPHLGPTLLQELRTDAEFLAGRQPFAAPG